MAAQAVGDLVNVPGLERELRDAGLDAVVGISPESPHYLSASDPRAAPPPPGGAVPADRGDHLIATPVT
jgi:hypothetical protein